MTTMSACVLPLRDHFGRVIGVLQAMAKQTTAREALEARWETRQQLVEPKGFSSEDVQFLQIISDKISSSLQLMALHAKDPLETVELQQVTSRLLRYAHHHFRSPHPPHHFRRRLRR